MDTVVGVKRRPRFKSDVREGKGKPEEGGGRTGHFIRDGEDRVTGVGEGPYCGHGRQVQKGGRTGLVIEDTGGRSVEVVHGSGEDEERVRYISTGLLETWGLDEERPETGTVTLSLHQRVGGQFVFKCVKLFVGSSSPYQSSLTLETSVQLNKGRSRHRGLCSGDSLGSQGPLLCNGRRTTKTLLHTTRGPCVL